MGFLINRVVKSPVLWLSLVLLLALGITISDSSTLVWFFPSQFRTPPVELWLLLTLVILSSWRMIVHWGLKQSYWGLAWLLVWDLQWNGLTMSFFNLFSKAMKVVCRKNNGIPNALYKICWYLLMCWLVLKLWKTPTGESNLWYTCRKAFQSHLHPSILSSA